MASSSVSQDDIDNDFEKNSRRSRIRTARARQINPSGCRVESGASSIVFVPPAAAEGGGAVGGDDLPMPEAADSIEDVLPPAAATADRDSSSPRPPLVRTTGGGNCKDKRLIKLHHVTKVKQQRDRRKLREKRRSTGVVHVASTESTGGSTTGDDDANSSDAATTTAVAAAAATAATSHVNLSFASAEVKRNESIANSYRKAQEKLGTWNSNGSSSAAAAATTTRSSCGSWAAAASSSGHHHHHHHHHQCQLRGSSSGRRDKSPSDLEADDENDHDSLNQSETGSGSDNRQLVISGGPQHGSGRAAEENKRLLSLMEEKDRRIHLLEYKVQQLMRDTLTISEEQSRLQKENSTLLRALSKLTKDKVKR